MKDIIRVRELSDWKIEKLDKRKGFKDFRPVECTDCSFKGTFRRRLFLVEGLNVKSDRGILRRNMKQLVSGVNGALGMRYPFKGDGTYGKLYQTC
jgi:hypothetical protein